MDAAQKFIFKRLGTNDNYQSVLNVQKCPDEPFRAVKNEHIQELHDGSGHWSLVFCRKQNTSCSTPMVGKR